MYVRNEYLPCGVRCVDFPWPTKSIATILTSELDGWGDDDDEGDDDGGGEEDEEEEEDGWVVVGWRAVAIFWVAEEPVRKGASVS